MRHMTPSFGRSLAIGTFCALAVAALLVLSSYLPDDATSCAFSNRDCGATR